MAWSNCTDFHSPGRKGRPNLTGYEFSPLQPMHSACLALLLSQVLPALFFSCSPGSGRDVRTPVELHSRAETGEESTLDLFFFEAEQPCFLDAYERVQGAIPARWEACSRSGRKRLVAVAHAGCDRYAWSDIRSLANLDARETSLETEDPSSPIMTASATVNAGAPATLTLSPLLSEIRLHSLCCDFHDRAYVGARLENVRVYLVNVRDRCRLDGESVPSWLNAARLDPERTAALRCPETVLQALPEPVGDETVFPDIRLYAYPNPAAEDGIGSPFTRLVIEGTLLGITCYYPISITPMEGGKSHVFDVTLTRAGTSDPDIPATREMVRLVGAIAPWNDMDPQIQTY
ncbi:MAG: hypothetical protein IKH49_06330 [Bacteroidales bacterium]|nr:hypothetical protein [Bacteroidales bacterium]